MSTDGSLKTIQGQRKKRRSIERKFEELASEFEKFRVYAASLEEKLARYHVTLREIVNSVNTSNVLLSSVERFLDETHGEDWDDGVRKAVEHQAEILKRRKVLIDQSKSTKELTDEERTCLGRDFLDIAREAGTRSQDVGMIIALFLQSREVNLALDVVEEIRRDEVTLSPEIEKIVLILVKRCAEIARQQSNEVAIARSARVSPIVDPLGNPIFED